MMTRKEMKKRARQAVKKHYGIFLAACLIAAFVGSEFGESLNLVKQYDTQQAEETGTDVSTGGTTGAYEATMADALINALDGDIQEGKEISSQLTQGEVEKTKEGITNPMLGRSRGVLAGIVNGITSGSFLVSMISAARGIGASQNVVLALFIILALLIWFCGWFFFVNMYQAVSRRIFLEGRIYNKIPIQRFLVFLRVRRWCRVSMTMFMTTLLYGFWCLTIVGIVVKKYSYYMVPYIVAENPDIRWRDAITLSRKMMDGHKWECFVFECSFIPWKLLGVVTSGLSDIFFLNSYRMASFAEYYAEIRAVSKEKEIPGSELLNDRYLFEKADEELLKREYNDVIKLMEMPVEKPPLKGIRAFLAEIFGITIFNRDDEERFRSGQERQLKILYTKEVVKGNIYPSRLSVLPEKMKNGRVEQIHYLRHYSVSTLILLFFIYSFVGWLWEVSLHLITDGEFVNRGIMHGPWLPIYGAGAVLILTILYKFRRHPLGAFIMTIILCGFIEYFSAYYLEITHNGQKWWDYSGYFLNLHGRICGEGLLVFGLGGMAIMYLTAPLLDNFLRKIPYKILVPLCVVLILCFGADSAYSKKHPNVGKGITDYKGACIEIQHERQEVMRL